MKISYILSDELPYEKLICNDAGPAYATSMQWPCLTVAGLNELEQNHIYVIDNRISAIESELIRKLILASPQILFIVKIVDPYFEHCAHFYYQWLAKIVQFKNVRLFSVYEPKELGYFISKLSEKPIIYTPYVYDPSREIGLENLAERKSKLIISGAINDEVYPYRSAILKKTRRSVIRPFFHFLKHPGYPDVTDRPYSHQFVGDNFISYLANFKYMLLCASRCGLEFYKFHESAYAGCLPVGQSPSCFPEEIKNLFTELKPDSLFKSSLELLYGWSKAEHFQKITTYRDFLQSTRSVKQINQSFLNQL